MITVVSTGFSPPTKTKCLASVASQKGVDFEHIYIDAGEQAPPKSHFENLLEACASLPPDRIIAAVDGDDWLAHDHALEEVQRMHDSGAWVTYGSFKFADGRPGFGRAYKEREPYRTSQWLATHLKTFRAGLFKRIALEHLQFEGKFLEHARDLAVMFPMMEMAGPARVKFCADILYTYSFATSTEFLGDETMLQDQRRCVDYVRNLPPYRVLERL